MYWDRTHPMAISMFESIPSSAILGMSLTRSMYATLQPVPKMQAIRVFGFTSRNAISVPVVSHVRATTSAGTDCIHVHEQCICRLARSQMTFGVGSADALRPSYEHTVVNSLLPAQRQPSSLSTWTTTYEQGYGN